MTSLLRANPGLIIWLAIFGVGGLICAFLGILMSRAGLSIRPVCWFAGLMLLIGAPQFIAHLYFAVSALNSGTPRFAAMQNLGPGTARATRQESAKLLFGPDADGDLVIDARPVFGDALAKAEGAFFASLPAGETVLLARFRGYSDAERAWFLYLRHTGLNTLGGKGDSQRGYAVTRPTGDRAYVLHFNDMIAVWTGPNDPAIRKRMLAGGFKVPRRAPLEQIAKTEPAVPSAVKESQAKSPAPMGGQTNPLGSVLAAGGLVAYLLLVVIYFFKVAAWAGSSPARDAPARLSGPELIQRLQSLNTLDVPFRIERGETGNELISTWRHADAKWIDLARAHGLRRLHRIKLTLDESDRTVRATDFVANYDWSAGAGGASIAWKAATGINFFQYEHHRVIGLQLDEQGRFKQDLSYAYTVNLKEMKSPLIEVVTRAGWDWRPVIWQSPKWLRWLTE